MRTTRTSQITGTDPIAKELLPISYVQEPSGLIINQTFAYRGFSSKDICKTILKKNICMQLFLSSRWKNCNYFFPSSITNSFLLIWYLKTWSVNYCGGFRMVNNYFLSHIILLDILPRISQFRMKEIFHSLTDKSIQVLQGQQDCIRLAFRSFWINLLLPLHLCLQ